jgi:LuxR family transcriptional regulator, maltose regulon positive regulatory protein
VETEARHRAGRVAERDPHAGPLASFKLQEAKLHPPSPRPGIVARPALVDRLMTGRAPLVCLIAPPGYGKTTLLAEWAGREPRPVAWVAVDRHDNDPAVLLTYLALALHRIRPLDPAVFTALASPGAAAARSGLVAAVSAMTDPVCLVLDHVELLTNRQCLDDVAELALHLPAGSQLLLASRFRPPLPLAMQRAEGRVLEIGAAELAMDGREARALLEGAGVAPTDPEVAELVGRTEGWPVGLYLAALALQAGGAQRDAGFAFTGDDRFMADYLRQELLARLPPELVSFLTRTAVLDRMSGPLCDAVLETGGSARVLASLERSNLLLVALDRDHGWYRYHHLFGELLRAELERREPELPRRLHVRAAGWCEANELPELAVDHARAAGDTDLAARLVLGVMQPIWASGRVDTVLGWMEWFEDRGLIERYPAVSVHGALVFALLGRPAKAERWAAAAERAPVGAGRLPDGSTMRSYLAYLRALLCRDGVAAMRADAEEAWQGLSAVSPYRATMLHTLGVAHQLEGDLDRADPVLAEAFDAATRLGAPPLAAVVLAERGIVAAARGEWAAADALAARALALVRGGDFDAYWTSALVYAWAARAAVHRGDLAAAREHVTRAARLRPLLTYALPVVSVQALLELARADLALGDPDGAHAVLGQVQTILQRRPSLGVLPAQADELRSEARRLGTPTRSGSSLTTAELRVLPLLATHLTSREIAERLYLSPFTVKTQTISIYRKFGVSSRSAAVARAQEIGLLHS